MKERLRVVVFAGLLAIAAVALFNGTVSFDGGAPEPPCPVKLCPPQP